MSTRVIHIYSGNELHFNTQAKEVFPRHFDNFDSFITNSYWLGTDIFKDLFECVNRLYPSESVYVFVSSPSDVDPIPLFSFLKDRLPKRFKVFAFLQEGMGALDRDVVRVVQDKAWSVLADGFFVASAYHAWFLKQQGGWPESRINCVGYPVDFNPRAPLGIVKEVIGLPYYYSPMSDPQGIDFLVDVIQCARLSAKIDAIPFLCDIHMPNGGADDDTKWLLRETRLCEEGNFHNQKDVNQYPLKVAFSPSTRISFDHNMARAILNGAHPVVPADGCYMEMMQIQHSKNRYTYEPGNIDSCIDALERGFKNPSPPISYIREHVNVMDEIAKAMLA